MPLNQGSCRDCGGRLLGTDRGRCGNCERATETPQERAAYLLRDKGNATEEKQPKGNVTKPKSNATKVLRPKSNVTEVVRQTESNVTETKQQRWAKKNADRRREIDRAGQQRRRA